MLEFDGQTMKTVEVALAVNAQTVEASDVL